MTMNTAIADAHRRTLALDLSTENARIVEIDAQVAQIEQALNMARARHQEILLLLRPFSGDPRRASTSVLSEDDGRVVADALLAGMDPSEAAATKVNREQLEEERDALKEGMTDLGRRMSALTEERRTIPSGVGRRALAALQPLCDELESQAREAAQVIVDCFASLSAIGRVTRSNPMPLRAAATAVAALRGPQALLTHGDNVDVPEEITEVLALLSTKGPAYTGGKPTTVQVRDGRAASELIGSMFAGGPTQPAESYQ